MRSLPLTLTLSPQAGRGDVPQKAAEICGEGATSLLRPASGEKVPGRADEGQSLSEGAIPCP